MRFARTARSRNRPVPTISTASPDVSPRSATDVGPEPEGPEAEADGLLDDADRRPPALGWAFAWAIVCAVPFMAVTHEFGHWLVYTLLGYDATLTLNTVGIEGDVVHTWHRLVASAAGPAVTVLQAGVAFVALRRGAADWVFAFLLSPFVYRLLAMGANVGMRNDEGRLSEAAGLGGFTIFVIVCSGLLALVVATSRRRGYSWKRVVLFGYLSSVCIGLVVIADNVLGLRLL